MPRSTRRVCTCPSRTTSTDLARLHREALPDPVAMPLPFDLACWSKPVDVIGGDVLAAWAVGRDQLVLFLGDVMGHDLTAAVIASAVRLDLYRARVNETHSPATILCQLDQSISDLFPGHFVTAACCLLDARSQTMTWSVAGHPPILVLGGEAPRALHHQMYPLGVSGCERYQDERASLPAESSVLLYSDGITDPLNSPDYPGHEVLAELLSEAVASPAEMVRTIRRTIRPFRRTDDRSLLGVRVRTYFGRE